MKPKKIPMGVGRPLERSGHKTVEELSAADVKVSVFEEFNAATYVPPVVEEKPIEKPKVVDNFWPTPEFDEEIEEKLDRDLPVLEDKVQPLIEPIQDDQSASPASPVSQMVVGLTQKRKVKLDKKIELDKLGDEIVLQVEQPVSEQQVVVQEIVEQQIDEVVKVKDIKKAIDVVDKEELILPEIVETKVEIEVEPVSDLIQAILKHDIVQVNRLLEQDVNLDYQSALDMAVEQKDKVMIEALMFHKFKQTFVQPALEQQTVESDVQEEVFSDTDLNEQDEQGMTLLMRLIDEMRFEEAKELVIKGVDVNVVNINGATALILSSSKGDLLLVKFLVDAGADVNAQDEDGYSALHYATFSGNGEIANYLVNEAGIDVNLQDKFGRTVLMWHAPIASFGNQMAIIENLINHGADIKIQNYLSKTMYDIAVEYDQSVLVEYLLSSMDEENDDENGFRF